MPYEAHSRDGTTYRTFPTSVLMVVLVFVAVESVMTSPDISPTSSVESSHNYFARRMSCDYPAAAAGQHQVAAGLFRSSFDGRTSLWPRQPQDHGAQRFP